MHKPWAFPQFKQIRKEKTERNIFYVIKLYLKFTLLSLTFHSWYFFATFRGTLLSKENKTV